MGHMGPQAAPETLLIVGGDLQASINHQTTCLRARHEMLMRINRMRANGTFSIKPLWTHLDRMCGCASVLALLNDARALAHEAPEEHAARLVFDLQAARLRDRMAGIAE